VPEVNRSAIEVRLVNPPRKSRLLIGVLVVLIGVPLLTPLAICWIFFLGKVYGNLVLASNLALMAFATWFLESTASAELSSCAESTRPWENRAMILGRWRTSCH